MCCKGEKYLVLKKKYRQMLQEKEAKHPRIDGEGQKHSSPARAATAHWDARDALTRSTQQDEPMSCREPAAEVHLQTAWSTTSIKRKTARPTKMTQQPNAPCFPLMWMAHLSVNKAVSVRSDRVISRGWWGILCSRQMLFICKLAATRAKRRSKGLWFYIKGRAV